MLYSTLLFLHIASVLWFTGGHGVAIAIGYALPRERRLERIKAYLELSRRANIHTTGPGTILIIGTGVALGYQGHWWRMGWVWLSLALLIILAGLAMGLVAPHYRRVRALVERDSATGEVSPDLQRCLAQHVPSLFGYAGLLSILFILAMMAYKPF